MEIPSTLETDEFPDEKWFFINGIIVGDYWLDSAVNKLSKLFKRKVHGIRNRTYMLKYTLLIAVPGLS